MFDFNKTTSKFDDLASFSNTRRHLQYAEYAFNANYYRLLASDINDPYLRAAFLGDFLQIKYFPFLNTVKVDLKYAEQGSAAGGRFQEQEPAGVLSCHDELAAQNCELFDQ